MFVPFPEFYVVVPETSFVKLSDNQQLDGWIM